MKEYMGSKDATQGSEGEGMGIRGAIGKGEGNLAREERSSQLLNESPEQGLEQKPEKRRERAKSFVM